MGAATKWLLRCRAGKSSGSVSAKGSPVTALGGNPGLRCCTWHRVPVPEEKVKTPTDQRTPPQATNTNHVAMAPRPPQSMLRLPGAARARSFSLFIPIAPGVAAPQHCNWGVGGRGRCHTSRFCGMTKLENSFSLFRPEPVPGAKCSIVFLDCRPELWPANP